MCWKEVRALFNGQWRQESEGEASIAKLAFRSGPKRILHRSIAKLRPRRPQEEICLAFGSEEKVARVVLVRWQGGDETRRVATFFPLFSPAARQMSLSNSPHSKPSFADLL